MRKFLFCFLGVLVTACAPHNDYETYDAYNTYDVVGEAYIPSQETQFFVNAPVVQEQATKTSEPVTSTNQHVFSANKTYMAELAKQLRKAAGTSGILVKKQEATELLLVLPDEVIFGTNKTTLDTQAEPILAEMARALKKYDATKIHICGYTDNIGSVATNQALSLQKANTISNFLRLNGVDINRIVVDGLGQQNPLTNNNNATNRRRNRRVEITLSNMQ